jgi:choline transport protein
MLGFASTVMASWEVLLVLFKLTLMTGGFPNLFWGFIVNVCGMLFVYASIAELASMYVTYPTVEPRTVSLTVSQVTYCWRSIP